MTRRTKFWLAATVFTVINAAGGVYAAVTGEALHAGSHFFLAGVGAYLMWRLAPIRTTARSGGNELSSEDDDRMTHLEQSIDAVAIEVERLGEGQRFMTRLVAEEGAPVAEPVANKPPSAPPNVRRD